MATKAILTSTVQRAHPFWVPSIVAVISSGTHALSVVRRVVSIPDSGGGGSCPKCWLHLLESRFQQLRKDLACPNTYLSQPSRSYLQEAAPAFTRSVDLDWALEFSNSGLRCRVAAGDSTWGTCFTDLMLQSTTFKDVFALSGFSSVRLRC